MHVAPGDLRTLRQDGILIRFAVLGEMAYVLAEIPPGGTAGTSLEKPCNDPHWGFVIDGEVTFVRGRRRETIAPGRAFHVPAGGPAHHFETTGRARLAGFAPIDPAVDLSEPRLVAQGFELVAERSPAIIVPPVQEFPAQPGAIATESWTMSGFRLARSRMGERSGYTAGWCDAAHWGLVTSGGLTIEWENDVEVLAAGDVFHCQAGPPGHRIEAADPATVLDLTPLAAFDDGRRLAKWRRRAEGVVPAATGGIAVAPLG